MHLQPGRVEELLLFFGDCKGGAGVLGDASCEHVCLDAGEAAGVLLWQGVHKHAGVGWVGVDDASGYGW